MPKHSPNLPQNQERKKQSIQVQAATFSGPLPHPSILQEYERISPGFADRIVKMAESEAEHRRKLEDNAMQSDIDSNRKEFTERRIGQILAFLIAVFMSALGGYLVANGHPIVGSIFGGPAIVSIVGAFLYRKTKNHS